MLKADLHIHVDRDPCDTYITHTARDVINAAAKQKFDVLAITCHDYAFPIKEIQSYAKKKGILLVQGAEKTLKGKHVLIYNINNSDLKKIKTFNDLRELKKEKNILVVAPHPYYPLPFCLKKDLEANIDVFDAIEYSHAHMKGINPNKKAVEIAKKFNKPLIANSDTHNLFQIGFTYSFIESDKTAEAVIEAIKQGKAELVSPPLSLISCARIVWWVGTSFARKIPAKIYKWI